MQFAFSYNKKQVIQALRLHFIGRNEVRILIVLVNVFAIFAAAMFYYHKVSPLAFLLSSFLWIGLMIAFWFILPNSVYKKTTTFSDEFTININDQKIELENDRGYMQWQWKNITRYIESPHFFHLYFDSKSFFLLPKKPVEDAGDLAELRRIFNKKISMKYKL